MSTTTAVFVVQHHPLESRVRPLDEQFVRGADPLPGRERRPRVGDDRVPAELLRAAAERLGDVDGAEDDEPVRRRLLDEPLELAQRHPLDPDVDLTAARQPDRPGLLVGDPVREHLRLAALEHLPRGERDLALDAAARYRPGQLSLLGDGQLRTDRSRSGAPCGEDRGESKCAHRRGLAIE